MQGETRQFYVKMEKIAPNTRPKFNKTQTFLFYISDICGVY